MLELILGRAKSGKTAMLMQEMHAAMQKGANCVLLIPEQYSHEAEREALRICGDSFSLGGEVLSFSRFATRILTQTGGLGAAPLSPGGKLLCMSIAHSAVSSRLHVYKSTRQGSEILQGLIAAVDEIKTGCITSDMLLEASSRVSGSLTDKLHDLHLVLEAYESILAQSGTDPSDLLTRACDKIEHSSFAVSQFFMDGFVDFTMQEQRIIEELLRLGASVSVCLGCESLAESHEIFEPSRRAAVRLQRAASSASAELKISLAPQSRGEGTMEILERELFSFSEKTYPCGDEVTLCRASSIAAECEAAAARCISLVRDSSCRFRDIAIAVRGYDAYAEILEGVLRNYGVAVYSAAKTPIMQKPLMQLVSGAFEIVSGGFAFDDVISYLKTGLCGLQKQECDELQNYAFMWTIRGSAWYKDEPWTQHPDGYGREFDETAMQTLERVNALRLRAISPLRSFMKNGERAKTAREQCEVLLAFFEELNLSETLSQRAAHLQSIGLRAECAEYLQLWEIIVSSLEQCAEILGDMPMDQERLGELFCLMLQSCEVGTIPLSLDNVTAGDFDRMRRRSIKHLIVLGCDSGAVPSIGAARGIFSDDDREALVQAGLDIGDTAPDRLCREFALAYNCLTLASETIYMSYVAAVGEEGASTPSFVLSRAAKVFNKDFESVSIDECRKNAPAPAFELAAKCGDGANEDLAAIRDYFISRGAKPQLDAIEAAAKLSRGRLSRPSVDALYGKNLRLSASRADSLASCHFAHFLRYGLRAKPRQAAKFSPPEMGTFIHYVLEGVVSELCENGGLQTATDAQISAACTQYVRQYVSQELNDFREKSGRFVYLFNRLAQSAKTIAADVISEIRKSDFKPLSFELDFGNASVFPPLDLGDGQTLSLNGIVDRVDGYLHDGRLYVRVADYKTGTKTFSLSDILYGRDLQMLMYLFMLEKHGESLYGSPVSAAGVLYVPAKNPPISSKTALSDEELKKERASALKRSGLVLMNDEIIEAMEHGEKQYIPVKITKDGYSGSLASAQQLGELSRYVEKTLSDMAAELRSGSIEADPYFKSRRENACAFCEFSSACHFDEQRDKRRYAKTIRTPQVWGEISKAIEGSED